MKHFNRIALLSAWLLPIIAWADIAGDAPR